MPEINYVPTIGLEIHVELKTKTKMFCSCPNESAELTPNVNTCPICLGHPGTMPTINKEAVKAVIKLGLALSGTINAQSRFSRKSYFYPDLPKGYQISQYESPFVEGGNLKAVRIRRIHLEEDTGRLLHAEDSKHTLVDFNRAGRPLMELVTEPDIKNPEEITAFAKELQLILRYLDISNGDMEKGEMRVEVNISLSPDNQHGTKVELKNINSFKAAEAATRYEMERQKTLLEKGKKVRQETRGWNEVEGKTETQRSKESAHDYRYLPEPDLPPVEFADADVESLRIELPELPETKKTRLVQEYKVTKDQAFMLVEDQEMASFFENAVSELETRTENPSIELIFNYLTTDLKSLLKNSGISLTLAKVNPEKFAHMIFFVQEGKLSSRLAKNLLLKMFETGEDPEVLIREGGLEILSNQSELEVVIEEVLKENGKAVEDVKKGKESALQALIGKVMGKTSGKADPKITLELLKKKISSGN